MLTVLSLMDDRSRPKGSRDPLGIEAIWSSMGRKLVGNLTTVTSNLDHFMVALLCCHYSNTSSTDPDDIQQKFLCAEQLSAYLRLAVRNEVVLGITRAKANFKSGHLPLGRGGAAQILSNQLSYGLWGLYSTAMQLAGLINGSERRLTEQGRLLVEGMLNCLGDDNWQLFTAIADTDVADPTRVNKLAPAFNNMLRNVSLRCSVVDALLNWQTAKPLQLELYTCATTYLAENNDVRVQAFCAWLLAQEGISPALRQAIQQIDSLEPVLVLAATLMNWLQGQKGRCRADLLDDLQPCLEGLVFSNAWQAAAKLPHASFLKKLYEAGVAQNADALMSCVLEQNKKVMLQRGGAAWLEWQGDLLQVRVVNDRATLPENIATHCSGSWWNSYFIGSFLQIAKEAV